MKTIQTEKAPQAIGPYSQATVAGEFVFCSGQIALDHTSGGLVAGGIKEQTTRVFENLKEMNEVYAEAFGAHKPARITVGVSALPKNALVEISCVAQVK